MSLKSFIPFAEGSEIKAADFNTTYKANGLQGTIATIERDQFASEGFGLEAFNNIRNITTTKPAGAGCPAYLNLGTSQLTSNYFRQALTADFVEISSGTDLEIAVSSQEMTVLQTGDIIVVEFVGALTCAQYGINGFGTVAADTYQTPSIKAGTDKHQDYWAELSFFVSVNGATHALPVNTASFVKHRFSSWCRWGTSTTTTNVSFVSTDNTFSNDNFNMGIGAIQPFHMTMFYVVGSETTLNFKVSANPNAGTGSQTGTQAEPGVKIFKDSTMFAHVLRRAAI